MEIKRIMLMNGASFRKGTSFYLHGPNKPIPAPFAEKAIKHYPRIPIGASRDREY
jgi:hypothetical protein